MNTPTPEFANLMMDGMIGAGYINCSELARRAFGTIKDDRGYDVARKRDRVGAWLKGTGYPNPANLARIAIVLGIPEAELAAARRPDRSRLKPMPAKPPAPAKLPVIITGRFTLTIYP